jgi:DNA-3-methyladenine glycosylase
MGTDLRQDGLDLCTAGTLWLAATAQNTGAIGKSVRIGLTRNANYIRVLTCRILGPGMAPG